MPAHAKSWKTGWFAIALCLLTGCASGLLHTHRQWVGERLEVIFGGGGNSGVLLHGREALVVDAKLRPFTRRLAWRVEHELAHQVRRLVLTHSHFDHTQGTDALMHLGAVMAHPRAIGRLTGKGGSSLPFVEVSESLSLWLGGEPVAVRYFGAGHTDGDLVVYFPRRKLVFTGDLMVADTEPLVDEAAGGDILAFRSTLDRLLTLDFEQVVPGHGDLTDRAAVLHFRNYFAALETAVKAQLEKGRGEDDAVREVSLPGFDNLRPLPLGFSSREKSIRMMYKALTRHDSAHRPLDSQL